MQKLPTGVQAALGTLPFIAYAILFHSGVDSMDPSAFSDPFENHDSGLSYWIPPVFAISIAIDIILNILLSREKWSKADTFSSIFMGLAAVVCSPVIKYVQWTVFVAAFTHGIFAQGNSIMDWVVCFMAGEYLGYWFHRMGHEVNFLWAAHFTHHSSDRFNLAIGIRNNVIHIFYKFFLWVPLCWLGFHPVMVITCDVLSNVYQFFIHIGWIGRLGFLDCIINTPSNHRVHHGCNETYLDKNYGGMLMLYDHIFGTYQSETEKPVYGLTDRWTSNNPAKLIFRQWWIIFHNLRREGWKNWRRILLGRPSEQPAALHPPQESPKLPYHQKSRFQLCPPPNPSTRTNSKRQPRNPRKPEA
jgi:sterol desaturase/sphingolipid hydroxylase (fatty acid hydroxylase superfamily)